MNQVIALKAFQDNYIWVIHNQSNCILVDPGEAAPVLKFLADNPQLTPTHILITHYHRDHTAGVTELKNAYADIQVYGPANCPYPNLDYWLNDGDKLTLPDYGLDFQIWHIPGHTLDHIAYFNDNWLFCGDTIFSAGCGRMFEGTPAQYINSLNRLCSLPDPILIFCAHEYTQANIRFALSIEPDNSALKAYALKIKTLRANNQISLPSNLKLEKQINPFLRCNQTSVINKAVSLTGQKLTNETETFAAIRQLKDSF